MRFWNFGIFLDAKNFEIFQRFYLFIFVLFIDRHAEIRSRICQVTGARSLLFRQKKSKQAVKKRIIISIKSRFHQGFLRFHQFSSWRNFFWNSMTCVPSVVIFALLLLFTAMDNSASNESLVRIVSKSKYFFT